MLPKLSVPPVGYDKQSRAHLRVRVRVRVRVRRCWLRQAELTPDLIDFDLMLPQTIVRVRVRVGVRVRVRVRFNVKIRISHTLPS